MGPVLRRWLRLGGAVARSRLVIFFVLGALIFLVAPRPPSRSRIFISRQQLAAIQAAAAAREPSRTLRPELAAATTARVIDDEVLYREALRLGIDQNDPVMRRHVIEKMLLLAEDLGGASRAATEAELESFFRSEPARWTAPETFKLRQLFFRSEARARAAASTFAVESSDAFPLPREIVASAGQLAQSFGDEFLKGVRRLAAGADAAEPIRSRYGWHRVHLVDRVPSRPPSFAEARGQVTLELARERRQQAVRVFLRRARERYRIEIEGGLPVPEPVPRPAMRMSPSGED